MPGWFESLIASVCLKTTYFIYIHKYKVNKLYSQFFIVRKAMKSLSSFTYFVFFLAALQTAHVQMCVGVPLLYVPLLVYHYCTVPLYWSICKPALNCNLKKKIPSGGFCHGLGINASFIFKCVLICFTKQVGNPFW